MRNGGVIVDRTIASRKERNGKKGEFIEFLARKRITRGNLSIDFSCRMMVDLFFHCSFKETSSKGKSSPRGVTIYPHWPYFRENIFIKKVVRRRIFPFMVTMVRSIALLFPLIEVWKILVIARCRVAKVKKKKIIKNFERTKYSWPDSNIRPRLEKPSIRKSFRLYEPVIIKEQFSRKVTKARFPVVG